MAAGARDRWLLAAAVLAAALLLVGLGDNPLSNDEAQTGLLARVVLSRGLPYASDGANVFGAAHHPEADGRGLWSLHPWGPIYVCASALWAFGVSPGAARLPFALCAVATVYLAGVLAGELGGVRAGRLAAFSLATSVPFLLQGRSARYYALAGLLTCAWALLSRRRGSAAIVAEVGVAVGLLFTHYLVFAGAAVGFVAQEALRGSRRRAAMVAVGVGAVAAAWFGLVSHPAPPPEGFALHGYFLRRYLADLNDYLIPFALAPGVAWAIARHARRPELDVAVAPLVATVILVPFLSITPGFRYLCAVLPLAVALLAIAGDALWTARPRWGPAVVGLVLATNLASVAPYALVVWPLAAASPRVGRLLANLGPAAVPDVPLRHLLVELATRNDSFDEVAGAWLLAHTAPGRRVVVSQGFQSLAFAPDLLLTRVVAVRQLRDGRLSPPDVLAYAPDRVPADVNGAWYVPACGDFRGLPADVSSWLGATDFVELPVAPCPRDNPADPRTHRFEPTPSAPPARVCRLPGH